MSDLNSMAEIVQQEIKSFDEKIREHTFHVNQLRDLLERISGAQVKPTKPVMAKGVGMIRHDKGHRGNKKTRVIIANKVANLIRENGCTKAEALRALANSGELSKGSIPTLASQLNKSVMGEDLYHKVFKGTKYVR